jgi:outer membrane protein OmpA-like peptidoglycan-associated protein
MIKKFLFVVFAFVMMGSVANAAVDPRTKCVDSLVGPFYSANVDVSPLIKADYAIYFDNDESDIPSDCNDDVNDLVAELVKKNQDIETVLLFGSTDSIGAAEYNAKLAQNRVNTVNELLQEKGVPVCEYGEDGRPTNRCAHISMGESFHAAEGIDNRSRDFERAVFLYVIYKSDICDADTIKILEQLAKKVTDSDIKTKLTAAQGICDTEGKTLVRSQREQIQAAIQAAVEADPKIVNQINLSDEEKVLLLTNILISVSNEFLNNRSVWKTAEGSFNGARLASDSIAGVVLGTAGGLITSSIVKKNQLSSGFDSVMCTIGGQTVASYGDEFRVGITTR